MLPAVTKKYDDRSTDRFFQFVFHCDKCGEAWESERYPFSMRDATTKSKGEKNARVILWKAEHDAAYERANNEALLQFNKCPKCGLRVCDSCFSEFEVSCLSCKNSKSKEVNHP